MDHEEGISGDSNSAGGVGRSLLHRRIVGPVITLLQEGVTPDRLALSVAIGAAIGVFPIVGTSTAVCIVVALGARLNLVAIQVGNYAVFPLQIAAIVPFARLGGRLLGAERLAFSTEVIVETFRAGWWHALTTLSAVLGHAVVGWAAVAPAGVAVLFLGVRPLLRRGAGERAEVPSTEY